MLSQLGHAATALGVAKLYADFVGTLVIDPADYWQNSAIRELGMRVAVTPTVMKTLARKRRVAHALLTL
jgi:LPPG:FO 2-phospho-L-lactate transferase